MHPQGKLAGVENDQRVTEFSGPVIVGSDNDYGAGYFGNHRADVGLHLCIVSFFTGTAGGQGKGCEKNDRTNPATE
ncbi:hypothetical protein GCM10027423_32410 [Spirosoma arcticum]